MKTRFTILLTLLTITGWAQTKISGVINDEKGEAVPGANIFIRDSYDGITADVEGKFSFTTAEKGSKILIATFLGYKQFQQNFGVEGPATCLQHTTEGRN